MTNRVVSIIGSAVCSVSVLCFAVSMIVGIFVNTLFLSCFASMFIALGFMLFMCAVSGSNKDKEKRACGKVNQKYQRNIYRRTYKTYITASTLFIIFV